jgi:hypothetical protein
VDALRRKYRRFLWDGEFRGTQDARVTSGGKPYEWYSTFIDTGTGKRAMVLANYEPKEAEFTVELAGWGKSLVMVSPEDQEPKECGGTIKLSPCSSVVLMEV